ncbi:alpha/beta fold hydrolase [Massilia sp.]|uniref:alpha/beta fold hydrolase n=1 Tax=Massilia sp. TaxID=1882437 RepID=UPI00289A466A|nr:alpha/beta fold hydrolase [Massilia sp.]
MSGWKQFTVGVMAVIGAGAAHAADYKPCDDAASHAALAGSLCAIEQVPADHAGAAPGATISLFVRKFPTSETARGQVWLIAGGPGESGASFYGLLPRFRQSFPGFDLIVPDHRGTGFSSRMCPQEEAPASPSGTALAGAEWGSCFAHLNANPAGARRFSQTNAAYDLKLLLERTARSGKTYVYGVSYGTHLVLRTVALGAQGIDGVVLDSLVPLQDDETADLSRRSLVADAVGRGYLARCDASRACSTRMGEPLEQIYRRVLARADREPALLAGVPGNNLKRFFGSLLDVPAAASQLPQMIKGLDAGDTARVASVLAEVQKEMAALGGFPQSPSSTPLVILISGAENNLQPQRTAQGVAQEEQGLLFASSLPGLLVGQPFPFYARDAWFARLPARLPPTLVIHGTRDAKTPYDAARRHVAALRKAGPVELFAVEDGAHFVLWQGSGCSVNAVRRFVLGDEEQARCVTVTSAD